MSKLKGYATGGFVGDKMQFVAAPHITHGATIEMYAGLQLELRLYFNQEEATRIFELCRLCSIAGITQLHITDYVKTAIKWFKSGEKYDDIAYWLYQDCKRFPEEQLKLHPHDEGFFK